MGKRKYSNNADIELGVVDNALTEPDNDSDTIITEEVIPEEVSPKVLKAIVMFTRVNDIWLNINGFGYTISTDKIEDWMVKGAEVYVLYDGTPGKSDFKISGIKE